MGLRYGCFAALLSMESVTVNCLSSLPELAYSALQGLEVAEMVFWTSVNASMAVALGLCLSKRWLLVGN